MVAACKQEHIDEMGVQCDPVAEFNGSDSSFKYEAVYSEDSKSGKVEFIWKVVYSFEYSVILEFESMTPISMAESKQKDQTFDEKINLKRRNAHKFRHK